MDDRSLQSSSMKKGSLDSLCVGRYAVSMLACILYRYSPAPLSQDLAYHVSKCRGTGPLFFRSSKLPIGLEIDRKTGTIYGQPHRPFKSAITVTAENAVGTTTCSVIVEVQEAVRYVSYLKDDEPTAEYFYQVGQPFQIGPPKVIGTGSI